eukprot:scaffold265435_cov35-Attheya_sp.AAC.1
MRAPAWSACYYLSILLVSRLEFWSESRVMDLIFSSLVPTQYRTCVAFVLCANYAPHKNNCTSVLDPTVQGRNRRDRRLSTRNASCPVRMEKLKKWRNK